MNNNIHNISKGKAPPGEKESFGRIFQSYCHFDGGTTEKSVSAEQKSNRFHTAFGMTSTGGTLLLNMRDGPRGRAPANRFAMGYGLVTLTKKSSVSLCVHSALSAVKENTTETAQHTRPNRAIYTQNPTKIFRTNCIPNSRDKLENGRLQEEKVGKDEGLVIKD
ncbi:hypothetical protein [uncultured Draconibacterium sp.]|uniref:hypothetical protein n=1 Tax=uncultured Draconibacterium sp. TaxID=1573823 RepID=UPI002AA91523|nr:hypothetical protein [uncultured Draconibacterium sp.]